MSLNLQPKSNNIKVGCGYTGLTFNYQIEKYQIFQVDKHLHLYLNTRFVHQCYIDELHCICNFAIFPNKLCYGCLHFLVTKPFAFGFDWSIVHIVWGSWFINETQTDWGCHTIQAREIIIKGN